MQKRNREFKVGHKMEVTTMNKDPINWSILLLTLLTVTFVFESVLAIFEIKTIRCPELKKLTLWQGPIVCKK